MNTPITYSGSSRNRNRSATKSLLLASCVYAFLYPAIASSFALTLGTFNFNNSQFGNTLGESDGGTFRSSNWLNVVNADPGNPGALTGANVNTGIANIGFDGNPPIYTIGYNTSIANGSGADLGIISARFSSDTFNLAVSTNGIDFTSFLSFGPELGVDTSVMESYYYGGGGPYPATLFVTPVDLSLFGLDPSATISAIQITSFQEGDLIRVAGLDQETSVPERGSTVVLLGIALLIVGVVRNVYWRCASRPA